MVLGTVLLPRQISAFRDRQILGTVHMEPMTAEELAAGEASRPEKLELLGRAIRYPELDVYSAAQPLEEAEEHTRAQAEAAFLQGVEKLAEWGVLPQKLGWTTLAFQGGSRVVYVQADGSLAASMLYLQGGTYHRPLDGGGRGHGAACVDRLHAPLGQGFPGHGGRAWTGLLRRPRAGDPAARSGRMGGGGRRRPGLQRIGGGPQRAHQCGAAGICVGPFRRGTGLPCRRSEMMQQ